MVHSTHIVCWAVAVNPAGSFSGLELIWFDGGMKNPCAKHCVAAWFLQVEGLRELAALLFLDISHNMVQQLDASQLPGSIKYLKVSCSTAAVAVDAVDLPITTEQAKPRQQLSIDCVLAPHYTPSTVVEASSSYVLVVCCSCR
jgi:hypothetical protein